MSLGLAMLAVAIGVFLIPAPAASRGRPTEWRIGHDWNRMSLTRRRSARRAAAITWVLAVAAELRSGTDPNIAVQQCTRIHGVGHHTAAAARVGAFVAVGLRQDAEDGDCGLLNTIASTWELSTTSGARMAEILESAADSYRRTLAVEQELAVELAAPRATAHLMTFLPLAGLVASMLIGAHPFDWMFTTPLGLATVAAGIACNVAGYLWIRQLVRNLEAHL